MADAKLILVTGATGFIGAHIVDNLLDRGLSHKGRLEFVTVADFEKAADFSEAVKGVGAIIHTASNSSSPPSTAPAPSSKPPPPPPPTPIRRIVLTSSFASVIDLNRTAPPFFRFTGADWNPITYEEAVDPATTSVIAYRGSKKFAERAAWDFIRDNKPSFDLVTLCPPCVITAPELPLARVPFWVDVRDLAQAHVEALLRPEVGGRRYVPASPEHFSYGAVAEFLVEEFPELKDKIKLVTQAVDDSRGIDGEPVTTELGVQYRPLKESARDLVAQMLALEAKNAAN
ncbi:unnamed protein product [Parascedosporium putredinis]|uniref:NAD-dependent epimerase/dehydratase domain-containing protein n=1 Tax=Parascedosporium putredinis TaxID=1442378 RepID=A0A9P1GYG6_9PEZI|nr:unnamed protein product [Parascedosporium putredinis]CAI7990726.1 unnamed protein product [Parascedosporium putredinis]